METNDQLTILDYSDDEMNLKLSDLRTLEELKQAITEWVKDKPHLSAKIQELLREIEQGKLKLISDFAEHMQDYYSMIQNAPINALSKVKTNNLLSRQIDDFGNAEIKVDENFTLKIKDYDKLLNGIPTTAHMLFHCFLIHYTEQSIKDARIRLPLKEYMSMRDLRDSKAAREQVLRDIEVLKLIEYEAKEKISGKWTDSGSISIYGGTGFIKNGIIHFNFNVDFFNSLQNSTVMDYSKETLRFNINNNPHAYYFSLYIDKNYRLNEGKKNFNIISLNTIIKQAPFLPSYDEVMHSSYTGNTYKAIIEPVIRDLDSIPRLFYDFIDTQGNIVDDPLNYFKGTGGYNKFINARLKIDYDDYKKHDERVERREKHAEKAKKIKQVRENKKSEKLLEERIEALEKASIENK